MQRLAEPVYIQSDPPGKVLENGLGISVLSPFLLMLEQSVMHLPIFSLFSASFRSHRSGHGIRMHADEGIVMKFQTQLFGIAVQDFLHKGMPGPANRAFIVSKLHQR